MEQALTPPFGSGDRLVWVVDSTLGQSCDDGLLARLQKVCPPFPPTAIYCLPLVKSSIAD
ncbi:hypothetical protein NON20_04380 [Synechocystis sp. B12]|nr:hypothetical protein NON20_04380 [Synechocystis sp. B12]